MVAFTGSPSTGRRVAALAAGRRLLLELGGNDPLVVLDDADLDHAARIAVEQAFSTSGQSCRGIKRVIAVDPIADALAERITALARPLSWGDPADPRTDVGPLIDEAAATVVERRCAVAVAAGARVLLGGRREGALHPPMVLDHVPADAELVVHETFGPVLPMIRVRSLDDAITVANGTSYGLQAGVITDSVDRFRVIAARLRVAAVNLLDGPAYESPHIPFGGVKGSGYGREGIRWGIEEMSVVKTITMPWGS
jgi:acyl-CoA reductase-like NAD-dependent aldehyde dehydrogenase